MPIFRGDAPTGGLLDRRARQPTTLSVRTCVVLTFRPVCHREDCPRRGTNAHRVCREGSLAALPRSLCGCGRREIGCRLSDSVRICIVWMRTEDRKVVLGTGIESRSSWELGPLGLPGLLLAVLVPTPPALKSPCEGGQIGLLPFPRSPCFSRHGRGSLRDPRDEYLLDASPGAKPTRALCK